MRNIPKKVGKILVAIGLFTLFSVKTELVFIFGVILTIYVLWELHTSKIRARLLGGLTALTTLFFIYSRIFFGLNKDTQLLQFLIPALPWLAVGVILIYYRKILRKIKS